MGRTVLEAISGDCRGYEASLIALEETLPRGIYLCPSQWAGNRIPCPNRVISRRIRFDGRVERPEENRYRKPTGRPKAISAQTLVRQALSQLS
jgi:hypothetical protein